MIAEKLIDAIAVQFGIDEVSLPANRIPTTGVVAYDGELLAVSHVRNYGAGSQVGAQVEERTRLNTYQVAWRAAEFQVLLIRCCPDIEERDGILYAPKPDAMKAWGEVVARDEFTTRKGILAAARADVFGPGPDIVFETWTAVGPAGGLGGGVLAVRISTSG